MLLFRSYAAIKNSSLKIEIAIVRKHEKAENKTPLTERTQLRKEIGTCILARLTLR
jgi:hypothetical protein